MSHKVNAARSGLKTELFEHICVKCGVAENLTIHHVVPDFIEKQLGRAFLNSSWHVPMCCECHEKIEDIYKPFYNERIIWPFEKELNSISWIRQLSYDISFLNALKNEPIKSGTLLRNLAKSSFRNLQEALMVDLNDLHKCLGETSRELKAKHVNGFIEMNGGSSGVREIFRSLFLDFGPQFLPNMSMINEETETLDDLESVLT